MLVDIISILGTNVIKNCMAASKENDSEISGV